MATPIRIKRSSVEGKRPQVSDLQVGELALNTYDAELVTLRDRSAAGIATEVVRIGAGATVTNVIYVTKDGNDNNTGLKLGDAKGTIKGAIDIASDGDVVKVSAGVYIENNPIDIPKQVSLVGDSLREVTITPQNADKDLFYVGPGSMLQELTFSGTVNLGMAAVAFNPDKIEYNPQSPYIRFCTNKLTNSIGMKVDGSKSIGPFRSMVTDSYTQYNANGIGVSLSNEGYAQIVSMFTMNLDIGIAANTGGQCDVTNSNSSFGNYGMVADGVGPRKYTGIVTESQVADKDTFVLNLDSLYVPHSVYDATYDGNSGIATITTHTANGLEVGMGITLSNFGFTCDYGDYPHLFVSGTPNGITDNNGTTYTAGAGTTYTASTGELVIDVGTTHGLSTSTNLSAIAPTTYTPSTGILQVTTNSDHSLSNGDFVKFLEGSFVFECEKDNKATQHRYPRISDPYYNKWLEVEVTSSASFEVNVGASSGGNYTHEFVSATPGGIKKAANTIGITTGGVTFTCSKDSYATEHPYPRTTDPAHNATLGIESVTDNTFTVNVGVATHDIFPTGLNGYIFEVNEVINAQKFSTYVGPNKYPHTYVSGGSIELDIVRPFDGQAVYFDTLYKVVQKINLTNGGSGYTTPPLITISEPSTSWGIKATAVAELTNGIVTDINIVSSGRGYTSTPSITIDGSATASVEMADDYYYITESTPVSNGISTITVNQRVPYAVGVGTNVPFYKQSRIIASSHSFEYIGTGVDPLNSLPSRGAVPIQENEIDDRNGGITIFTSTDQTGNFRIGDGVVINQQDGTITGDAYTKSLFSTMTPFILALGGD